MQAPVASAATEVPLDRYLDDCRELVLEEIRRIVPRASGHGGRLYELMLDYPLRGGKALRPALAIATCRALGGHLEAVLPSAAVLELYHNAFLIHDDVEDGSERRRSEVTLHRLHGVPIAVNVGDGILALSMGPLLDNIELLGLGRALKILQVVTRMARESAEGQMMELDWVQGAEWMPSDARYVRMVYKKTTWYTFLAPVLVGAIAAGARDAVLRALARFATPLGIAFQIQDDVLNLFGDEERYGKEIDGDLWEGKHTLLLIHALRAATPGERDRAVAVLRKRRPDRMRATPTEAAEILALIDRLARAGELSDAGRRSLHGALAPGGASASPHEKTEMDVCFLRELIERNGALVSVRQAAARRARRAARSFGALEEALRPSVHRDFLSGLVDYVTEREW